MGDDGALAGRWEAGRTGAWRAQQQASAVITYHPDTITRNTKDVDKIYFGGSPSVTRRSQDYV